MSQEAAGGAKPKARKGYHVQQREALEEAEALLRQKQEEHDRELRLHENLQRQLTLLESVTQPESTGQHIHNLVKRALAGQAASQAAHAPLVAPLPLAPAPATSHAPLQIDDLPVSLTEFDNAMLQRISGMTLDDCVRMYRDFVTRATCAVTHVRCHGDNSSKKLDLSNTVYRFGNLMMLQGMLLLPIHKKYLTLNFETLEEEVAPPGWYARVALLVPVHKEFAVLVQAGVTCVQKATTKQFESHIDVMQQVRCALSEKDFAWQPPSNDNLLHVDYVNNLLDRCNRTEDHILLLRMMLSVYLYDAAVRYFNATVLAETMISCWPYSHRGMVVIEEYYKRADVQAALLPE